MPPYSHLIHNLKLLIISMALGVGVLVVNGQSNSPLTPEQALAAFRLEPGLRVELVAAEPTVVAPAALAFDEQGRIYVAENRGYPTGPGEGKPPAGIIALLQDKDRDGRYETRTVFADGLTFPNGVTPWEGGVLVTCAPDILYLKDTDGDGRADVRRVVLTGFDDKNTTQLRVSHPTLGIDNWVYLTSGFTGPSKVTSPDHPERKPVEVRTDSRFRPDTGEFEAIGGRAQFGLTFDDFGHRFICMNRVHVQHVVLPSRYLRRNPYLAFSETVQNVPESMVPEPLKGHGAAARIYPISQNVTTADSHAGTFTAACGVHVYRGAALPEEYRGNVFACDPTGNLVHRDRLVPAGPTFLARRVREGVEFLASTDNWFRPVNLTTGPDGALYICDMYRNTIEHPQYLPEEIRKRTDFESGQDRGRIYRVVDERQKPKRQKVELDRASIKRLCAELQNPNAWWRETAQRLLIERKDLSAVPFLKATTKKQKANSETLALARVHALRTLEGLQTLDEASIGQALEDEHAGVREHGIQLVETRLATASSAAEWLPRLLALAHDPDARVRFQCALTLGELDDARTIPVLAQIALRDADQRWVRAAVLSSVGRRPDEFLRALLREANDLRHPHQDAKGKGNRARLSSSEGLPELMAELGRILGAALPRERIVPLLGEITASTEGQDTSWQMAAVAGLGDGLRSRGLGTKDHSGLMSLSSEDSSPAGRKLAALFQRSIGIATDTQQALPHRLAAVRLLGHSNFASAGEPLQALLDPQQPAELQYAAVRSLGQMPDPLVASTLLKRERWNTYTPRVREALLAALLTQQPQLPPLLAAIEAEDIPAWALTPAQRTQLTQHKEEPIRSRADALFKHLQSGDRMKVYEDYKSVLALKPNPQNGRAVFKQHCASCHRLDREGVPVGPDLFGIRNQPKEAILLHILVPEYEIMPGFAGYVIETKDGRTLSGLIASETATSVTLRRALGEEETILRANIAAMSATSLSLMPQEVEKNMSRQDLADLIAHLKGM